MTLPDHDCAESGPGATTATRPALRRDLRVDVVPSQGVCLVSELGLHVVRGTRAERVVPLLDGRHDVTALSGLTGEDPGTLRGLVTQLARTGLLSPDPGGTRQPAAPAVPRDVPPSEAYWDATGVSADAVAAALTAPVDVIGVDGIDPAATTAALESSGIACRTAPAVVPSSDAALSVVLCPDYLSQALADVDAAHRAAGRPWLLARPTGVRAWVGPVFRARDGHACWHCLSHRLWRHRSPEACVQRALGRSGPARLPSTHSTAVAGMASHAVALETVRALTGSSGLESTVLTLDTRDLTTRRHELRARPQCPSCGDPAMQAARTRRPVSLHPRSRASGPGGGTRAAAPGETLAQFSHLISPVTGVVADVVADRRGPSVFHSYRSGTNGALPTGPLETLRSALRGHSGGKGVTAEEARVGALGEAVERISATFHGDELRVRGRLARLSEAIDPDACQLVDPRQQQGRLEWNATHSAAHWLPEPFDPDRDLDWTPVWSLTHAQHRLLPTALLYFGAPGEPGWAPVRADSNGNAAGASLEDAILQGLLEVVERDAVGVWWYTRGRVPGYDLDALGDAWLDEVRATYAQLGRELWVLDVTTDIRVPVAVAVSRRVTGDREDLVLGCGAHLDGRLAVRRAVTELNQMMPAVLDGTRQAGVRDPDAARWWATARVADHPYLRPDPGRPCAVPAARPDTGAGIDDDVRHVQRLLEADGREVLVLDQTRPDIGLPVVKTIVPGMRHVYARFAPGRLYTAGVRAGHAATPPAYDDLNQLPLFV